MEMTYEELTGTSTGQKTMTYEELTGTSTAPYQQDVNNPNLTYSQSGNDTSIVGSLPSVMDMAESGAGAVYAFGKGGVEMLASSVSGLLGLGDLALHGDINKAAKIAHETNAASILFGAIEKALDVKDTISKNDGVKAINSIFAKLPEFADWTAKKTLAIAGTTPEQHPGIAAVISSAIIGLPIVAGGIESIASKRAAAAGLHEFTKNVENNIDLSTGKNVKESFKTVKEAKNKAHNIIKNKLKEPSGELNTNAEVPPNIDSLTEAAKEITPKVKKIIPEPEESNIDIETLPRKSETISEIRIDNVVEIGQKISDLLNHQKVSYNTILEYSRAFKKRRELSEPPKKRKGKDVQGVLLNKLSEDAIHPVRLLVKEALTQGKEFFIPKIIISQLKQGEILLDISDGMNEILDSSFRLKKERTGLRKKSGKLTIKERKRIIQITNSLDKQAIVERETYRALEDHFKIQKLTSEEQSQLNKTLKNFSPDAGKLARSALDAVRIKGSLGVEKYLPEDRKIAKLWAKTLLESKSIARRGEVLRELVNKHLENKFPKGMLTRIDEAVKGKIGTADKPGVSSARTMESIYKEITKAIGKKIQNDIINRLKASRQVAMNLPSDLKGDVIKAFGDLWGKTGSAKERLVQQNLLKYLKFSSENVIKLGIKNLNLIEKTFATDIRDYDYSKANKKLFDIEQTIKKASRIAKVRKQSHKIKSEKIARLFSLELVKVAGKFAKFRMNRTGLPFMGEALTGYKPNTHINRFFNQISKDSDKALELTKTVEHDWLKLKTKVLKTAKQHKETIDFEKMYAFAMTQQKGGYQFLKGIKNKIDLENISLNKGEARLYNYARAYMDRSRELTNDANIIYNDTGVGDVTNYFPVLRKDGGTNHIANVANDFSNKSTPGYTRKREGGHSGESEYVTNFEDVFLKSQERMNYFHHMAPSMRIFNDLTQNPKFMRALGKQGAEWFNTMNDRIQHGGKTKDYRHNIVDDLIKNEGFARLGGNPSSAIKQLLAVFPSFALTGKHFLSALTDYGNRSAIEVMEATNNNFRSSRLRSLSSDDIMFSTSNSSFGKIQKFSKLLLAMVDKLVYDHALLASYRKGLAKQGIEFKANDYINGNLNLKAMEYADNLAKKTQGSGALMDSPHSRTSGGAWRTIDAAATMFQMFIMNDAIMLWHEGIQKGVIAGVRQTMKQDSFSKVITNVMNQLIKEDAPLQKATLVLGTYYLGRMIEQYISTQIGNLYGSQKYAQEITDRTLLEKSIYSIIDGIPYMSNVFRATQGWGADTGFGILTDMIQLGRSASGIIKAKTPTTRNKNIHKAITTTAVLAGLPVSATANKVWKNIYGPWAEVKRHVDTPSEYFHPPKKRKSISQW